MEALFHHESPGLGLIGKYLVMSNNNIYSEIPFLLNRIVGHRQVPGFTTKWNNFLPIRNSTFAPTEIQGFFPKWEAPYESHS